MEQITIKEVVSKDDLKEFVIFPHSLFAHNPFWVPSLRSDEMETFSKDKNPSYKNCEAKLWLAYKNNEVVGRIAGIINHAYISKWKNKYARFGWIDFIEDEEVVKHLISTVERWASEKGMIAVHGPMGFTDFDPEGMLVEGFEEIASMTTIYNYPYYAPYLEKLGYVKDVDWLEYEITIPKQIPERILRLAELVEKRYELHSLKAKTSKELFVYARQIFDILNVAYKNLYGVVFLDEEQVDSYIKKYFSFIQPDFVSVVLDKNNHAVAFAISIPSLSEALQKTKGKLFPFGFIKLLRALRNNTVVDLYLIGIHPDLQSKGINAMLIRDLAKTFIKKNIIKAITHPALENNNKVLTLWKGYETRQIRRRRCYIKILERPENG
jgi:hypothetical protein